MDQDPDSSPLDDLRHYAYEGDGKFYFLLFIYSKKIPPHPI